MAAATSRFQRNSTLAPLLTNPLVHLRMNDRRKQHRFQHFQACGRSSAAGAITTPGAMPPAFSASARLCPDGIWNFDLDLEDRNFVAAIHLHGDAVGSISTCLPTTARISSRKVKRSSEGPSPCVHRRAGSAGGRAPPGAEEPRRLNRLNKFMLLSAQIACQINPVCRSEWFISISSPIRRRAASR